MKAIILEVFGVLVNDLHGLVRWGPLYPRPLPEGVMLVLRDNYVLRLAMEARRARNRNNVCSLAHINCH